MNERPLSGCTVNLSISEADDSVARRFPLWQVERVTLQVTAALLSQGANVVFGHDWREDGMMQAVHGFAQQIQASTPVSSESVAASRKPLLRNILPWPDAPRLSSDDLERFGSTLHVESAGLPAEVAPYENEARRLNASHPLFRYLRARGLTHLRRRLNAECDARLCIGGRTEGSAGRYPGVIEEALLAIQEGSRSFWRDSSVVPRDKQSLPLKDTICRRIFAGRDQSTSSTKCHRLLRPIEVRRLTGLSTEGRCGGC